MEDLYQSFEEAQQRVLTPEIIVKYINGELGYNELLSNRERLFNKFNDICNLIFKSVKETIRQKDLLTKKIENYLNVIGKEI